MPDSPASGVLGLLRRLVPPGVACGLRHVAQPQPSLPPDEAALTARMHPVRLREFTAGRAAARDALATLGFPAFSILAGPGRAPVWPAGVVGSITHTVGLAAAVAADARGFAALGLDAEEDGGLEARLQALVCRPEELARLAGGSTAAATAKLIFSAKEAAYKCLSPLTGIFLEFHDLEVAVQRETRRFRVLGHGPRTLGMPLGELHGRYGMTDGTIVTLCWLSAPISGTPGGQNGATGHG